jgi:SAM-dependent MidA family methyltransferase
MELALYDRDFGYYTGPDPRPGTAGDFLTAAEAHPIFGWALARLAEELWEAMDRPQPFVLREHGAGTGSLIFGLLDGLRRSGSPLLGALRYQPVEIEPRRTAELERRLVEAGHGARLDIGATLPSPITGLVLANEVIDALPVHRLRGTGTGLEELFVTHDDHGIVETTGPPSTPALEARLTAEGVVLRPGQVAEVCLAVDDWVAGAAADLARGLLLIVDYGYPASELYDPVRRPQGTLMAYRRHRASDDPFRNVGRQDLTAHLDVTAVQRAAAEAGLGTAAVTTQAELLAGLNAGELLATLGEEKGTVAADYLLARAALVRMLDPAAMGRFRVLAFERGVPSAGALRGLAFRLAR